MDCDQVFKILTRGPFPTGDDSDEQVEAHLEVCSDCWRLAEALRPALEVFQEAVPPAESRDLPGYWGDARPAHSALSSLTHGAARTALVAGVRHLSRTKGLQRDRPFELLPADVMRAATLAAAMTAAALTLLLLVRG
jgi:hypothetical protein